MKDVHCIFCKIATGEIPCHKIWEDAKHIAFLGIFPNTEGFTVVATKDHQPSDAFANDDRILANLILATKRAANLLTATFDDVSRCGLFFEGFGVDHLHSKLFPMHGTGDMENWQPIESTQPVYFPQYPGYLSSREGERADDAKLAKLAERIRAGIQMGVGKTPEKK